MKNLSKCFPVLPELHLKVGKNDFFYWIEEGTRKEVKFMLYCLKSTLDTLAIKAMVDI
ncbi:hypothetical protein SAMN05421852_10173 [Thermoflavimicrobium dichotomicum]|uniref:Uncharacterized protein n=1 Tax=Thermoflavimicrobium dichotomicum TaxID=46223 RepID=A0A1I3JGW9_9BACL|nr:hypothetical protein SAMN05421852_10173 [Thermoflavimicrobium dichotomicum]